MIESYINGKKLHVYTSIADAAHEMRVTPREIREVLDTNKTLRSMHWKTASKFKRLLIGFMGWSLILISIVGCVEHFGSLEFLTYFCIAFPAVGLIYASWRL